MTNDDADVRREALNSEVAFHIEQAYEDFLSYVTLTPECGYEPDWAGFLAFIGPWDPAEQPKGVRRK